MDKSKAELKETVGYLKEKMGFEPEFGLVLGSGLGDLVEPIEELGNISYGEVPNFPVSTALSHAGCLIWGEWNGRKIVAFQGRFHYYEGYSLRQVAFPVRVMKGLGCRTLITTNAAGSLNPVLKSGSVMVVTDHINLLGDNPLVGPNLDEEGPRFPDLGDVYTPGLSALALKIAEEKGLDIHPGILTAVSGPNFETLAEYRSFRFMGADAVGMSIIPEAIVAAHCGLELLALSGMTDECFHDELEALTGEQVVKVANKLAPVLKTLIGEVLSRWRQ